MTDEETSTAAEPFERRLSEAETKGLLTSQAEMNQVEQAYRAKLAEHAALLESLGVSLGQDLSFETEGATGVLRSSGPPLRTLHPSLYPPPEKLPAPPSTLPPRPNAGEETA